jgi:hypothetical protein
MKSAQFAVHVAVLGFVLLAVSGCGETNLVRDAAQGVGLAGRPSQPAPFVEQSRADAPTGFMAVGVSAPQRSVARKTPAEFKALEAQLEADKARLEAEGTAARQAGATPPPVAPPLPR